MSKREKIKKWCNEHKKEMTLISLGTLGFLILDTKIKKLEVFTLKETINTRKQLIDMSKAQNNTMECVIVLSEHLLKNKGSK